MKSVTSGFTDAQNTVLPKMVRSVQYKRRYWQQSTTSYIWEAAWTVLSESYVLAVSPVSWQLDTTTVNQFKVSNVTVSLKNFANEWKADNPYGRFCGDGVSPSGYESAFSKFQILSGYIKSDGTTETVPIFTGVAIDYNVNVDAGEMQITLAGEEQLLIGADAEGVSTTATNEVLGTGDGSTTAYTTAHSGVGIIKEVSLGGITKKQGTDYTISQTNDPSLSAKITFIVPPTAGITIRATYVYWQQNQKFETLVTSLLNQAGIPSLSQSVSPVTFPSSILVSHTYQTQADWVSGTLTAIDTVSIPNSIKIDYSDASAETATSFLGTSGWTTIATGTATSLLGLGGAGIGLNGGPGDGWAYRSSTGKCCGRWEATTVFSNTSGVSTAWIHFMFNAKGTLGTNNFYQGYSLKLVRPAGSSVTLAVSMIRNDSSAIGTEAVIGTGSVSSHDTSSHTFAIVRNPTGRMRVYYDGTLIIDITDTTYSSSTYTGFHWNNAAFESHPSGGVASNLTNWPVDNLTASWKGPTFDLGTTPNSWAQLQFIQSLSGATVTYYTRSSSDNITYGAWLSVPSNGAIASTLNRYLQARVDLTVVTANNQDPSVSSVTVGGTTSSTVVTLANFTGMTCFDAITALATFANYEFGFTSAEVFFFRPRSTSKTPLMVLTKSNQIVGVLSHTNGNDRVYSNIRATYAGYITEVYDDGLTPQGPKSRFIFNRLDINGGNILISKDADIATGIAGSFFGYFKFPRRRVKLSTKILPQVELSDVLSITFDDNTPQGWYIGDMSQTLSAAPSSLNLFGAPEQIVYQLITKVVGVRMDTVNWVSEIDVEEVI